MIKEKFLKFLIWLKDNFSFLLLVVVRLSLGKKNKDGNHEIDTERRSNDD